MAVHVTLSPPDGFEAWTQAEWDAWLAAHPWEPAEKLGDRSDWLVFLYQSRTHAKKTEGDLAPFMERLITEKPIASHEIVRLREALLSLASELERMPASRLWTGTQFYSAGYLHQLIVTTEESTGHRGPQLTIADLWRPLLARLDGVLGRAVDAQRGVYFGHVG